MSKDIFADQKAMMKTYGQKTDENSYLQTILYLKLMLEEMCETMCAANPKDVALIEKHFDDLKMFVVIRQNHDRVALFDGLIDTMVVTAGAGLSADLPMQEGWDEVLGSNMAKVDPVTGTVLRRADGKVLKPAGWTPPNLERVLTEHELSARSVYDELYYGA